MNPTVSIVVIGRNEGPRLGVCLDSVGAMERKGFAVDVIYVDSNSVDGYVTNLGSDTVQVTGEVRFIFSEENSMSRPAIVYPANTLVPAGQTARVARVKLAFQLRPGETCRFEVADAIRKA